jgi:hypothetical protein
VGRRGPKHDRLAFRRAGGKGRVEGVLFVKGKGSKGKREGDWFVCGVTSNEWVEEGARRGGGRCIVVRTVALVCPLNILHSLGSEFIQTFIECALFIWNWVFRNGEREPIEFLIIWRRLSAT